MDAITEHQALESRLPQAMADILEVPLDDVEVTVGFRGGTPDAVVRALGKSFVVEVSTAKFGSRLASHAERAARGAKARGLGSIPLVAVRFMQPAGMAACEDAGVSWIDFCGNARIVAPGIRVISKGNPNTFTRRGRPPSAFAAKSSRVARLLLMHPDRSWTQREIAEAAGLSEGMVSRVVSNLETEGLVRRDEGGNGRKGRKIRAPDARHLLDAWLDEYQFSKQDVLRGYVAARSGDELSRRVAETLESANVEHAATGLAAAWQYTKFAGFRTATFYVHSEPPRAVKKELGFREFASGANLWLAIPGDAGVFEGAATRDGVRCVHPLQAYLDLKDHPERAPEAAQRIRADILEV